MLANPVTQSDLLDETRHTKARHDLAAVTVEPQSHADQARERGSRAELARSAGQSDPLDVRHLVAEVRQPRLKVGVAERLERVRVLKPLDGGVEAKADHGDDVGEAREENELAAGPEVPRAEGKEEEDGDEDEERDEIGELGKPLVASASLLRS